MSGAYAPHSMVAITSASVCSHAIRGCQPVAAVSAAALPTRAGHLRRPPPFRARHHVDRHAHRRDERVEDGANRAADAGADVVDGTARAALGDGDVCRDHVAHVAEVAHRVEVADRDARRLRAAPHRDELPREVGADEAGVAVPARCG